MDRRHLVKKNPGLATKYPNNATGFQRWCRHFDDKYASPQDDDQVLSPHILKLMKQVPCRAEFYKYVQWHNRLGQIVPLTGNKNSDDDDNRVLVVHYEDYEHDLNGTVTRIMDFLEQRVVRPLRPFRALLTYEDHYSQADRLAAQEMVQEVANSETWELIRHYFVENY